MKIPEKKKTSFLFNGGVLALASVLVRFIGMIYRIPMVNIIGSEGNGYYSNAYSVYNILLLLSSYSMPLTVSKIVSALVAEKKWKETKKTIRIAFLFSVSLGLAMGLLCFFGADFFCEKVLHSPNSAYALKALAPTVLIMSVLGVLRGFFQGLQTTIPTAISQIIEQIINAIVSVAAAYLLFNSVKTGIDSANFSLGAMGGTIGTGAGALAALIFMGLLYFGYRKYFSSYEQSDSHKRIRSSGVIVKVLCMTAFPVILATAASNILDVLDSSLFNFSMAKQGIAEEIYSATWGDYNSAFLLLAHLPISVAGAIGVALVPSLAASYANRDSLKVNSEIGMTIKVTCLFSIPVSFGMMAVGGSLAKLLFPAIALEAENYLTYGGIAVAFFSLSTVTNAILQGLGRMMLPVRNSGIALIVHLLFLCLFLLVFKLGIVGVIISYAIYGLTLLILNLVSIKRISGFRVEPLHNLLIPSVVSAGMALICFLLSFIFSRFLKGGVAYLSIVLASAAVGACVYLLGIIRFNALTPEELSAIPYGQKLIRFFRKIHLM